MEDIHATDACIFYYSLCSVFLSKALSIFVNFYAQVFGFSVFQITIFSHFSHFRKSVIQWSYYPHLNNAFVFWLLRSVHLFLGLRKFKYELDLLLPFPFLFCLEHFSFGCYTPQWLNFKWRIFALSVACIALSKFK